MKSFSYEFDVESGFFEYDGKLWAKNYNFNLELTAKPKIETSVSTEVPSGTKKINKKLFDSFDSDGKISSDELTQNGSFPFGVKI